MKKYALITLLAMGLLTSCGRADAIDDIPNTTEAAETTATGSSETNASAAAEVETSTKASKPSKTEPSAAETTVSHKVKETTTATAQLVRGTTVAVPKRSVTPTQKATTKITGNAPVQTSSTAGTTTTTIAVTTEPATTTENMTASDVISCKITENGIEVSRGSEELQTIEIDTEELIRSSEEDKNPLAQITVKDYNFDGEPDLFIPQQIGVINSFGVYYRYDKDSDSFVKWDEMKDIDSPASVDEEKSTLTTHVTISNAEYETKVYRWNPDGTLALVSMEKQYRASEDDPWDILIDHIEYTNGEEVLVKREKVIFNDDHEMTGTVEVTEE